MMIEFASSSDNAILTVLIGLASYAHECTSMLTGVSSTILSNLWKSPQALDSMANLVEAACSVSTALTGVRPQYRNGVLQTPKWNGLYVHGRGGSCAGFALGIVVSALRPVLSCDVVLEPSSVPQLAVDVVVSG